MGNDREVIFFGARHTDRMVCDQTPASMREGEDAMSALRLVLGVMLWVLVLGLSTILVSTGTLRSLVASPIWLSAGIIMQTTMAAASFILIFILSKGKLSEYGFKMPTGAQIKSTFVFGSIAVVAVHIVMAMLWKLLPPSGTHPGVAGSSFLQIVVSVWIIASICEEVLHRGLIQSFLRPLRDYGMTASGIRLSLPVVTAAVLFGVMHLMLLTMGADGSLVGGIVGSAAFLGLVAGYHREKTGSLVPAILVHMLFNAYGGASEYIQRLMTR